LLMWVWPKNVFPINTVVKVVERSSDPYNQPKEMSNTI
jgi:hypothetical protein